ncbi:bcl2-associated agonist of cell death-like [Lepisosteus oculatus]|uniref:bcl2-associated agonist of cell death-like n=1 Tax=Lepisosteus oculatus TaxID=7918 RepID=UPI0035F52686
MTPVFSLSDDSGLSDDVAEPAQSETAAGRGPRQEAGLGPALGHAHSSPGIRPPEGEGRARPQSESRASDSEPDEDPGPFRLRSRSAPPALWAARKYGRELRRMSDEFDTCLDRGEIKRAASAGATRPTMKTSPSWWAFLWNLKGAPVPEEEHPNSVFSSGRGCGAQ